ncbi:MAG TPA: hypothetical protein VF006_09085 [Longimicrobium sp.]
MSERVNVDLREAKPSKEGGWSGLLLSLVKRLKEHVPFVLRPMRYVDQKIDYERARTRVLDAQARILEAQAQRAELENEGFSARGTLIGEKMAAHLLDGPAVDQNAVATDVPSLEEAAAALRAAAERLQELGIAINVSLTPAPKAEPDPATASDPIALPGTGNESE